MTIFKQFFESGVNLFLPKFFANISLLLKLLKAQIVIPWCQKITKNFFRADKKGSEATLIAANYSKVSIKRPVLLNDLV